MTEAGVLLERHPDERLHPKLVSTKLRPLDDVFGDSKADGRDISGIYETDDQFRGLIDNFNAAYNALMEVGTVTDDQLHALIDDVYADDAIQRRAEYLTSRPRHGDPTMDTDIIFCTYLDYALPIDPADKVALNQAQDGKLHWFDYILREGERVARSEGPVGEVARGSAEGRAINPSVWLRQELAGYENRTRGAKWWDIARIAGGIVLISTSEALLHDTNTVGVIAGVTLAGWGVLRTTERFLHRSHLKEALGAAETREQLAAILPVYNLPNGKKFAENGFKIEFRAAELESEQAEGAIGDEYWREMALRRMVKDYFTFSRLGGMEQGLGWIVRGMLLDYSDAQEHGLPHREKGVKVIAAVLDKYLPINQEHDTVTPVDHATGQKSWLGYVASLHSSQNDTQELKRLLVANPNI